MELQLDRNVLLRDVNDYISCFLCGGYLVEATTIVDCLHTFCKSCLLRRLLLKEHNCPKCGNLIHHSHPMQHIGFDRTLQDVVNKLVPDLQKHELERESRFCAERGIKCPKREDPTVNHEDSSSRDDHGKSHNYHRFDEQVEISLHRTNEMLGLVEKPYLVCSVNATIKILKKYVAKKIGLGIAKHVELDILCNNEILGKDHSLKFVLATRWRSKAQPLLLEYRPRVTLLD